MFSKTVYKMVRVDPQFQIPELTQEMRESLATLPHHPAYDYLSRKLRLQRSILEQKLRTERFQSQHDFEFVQSGVFWLEWLDNQLRAMTRTPAPTPTELPEEEQEILREIEATIQTVGK